MASTFEKTDFISDIESSGQTCWKAAANSSALTPASGSLFMLHCASKLFWSSKKSE